ncbi:hypothetical protein SLE2022_077220 [Rubroshorea leprosula]
MANISILRTMDRLWFHQVILFLESTSQDVTKTLEPRNKLLSSSPSIYVSSLPEAEISKTVSVLEKDVSSKNSSLDDSSKEDSIIKEKRRPRRLSVGTSKSQLLSFKPSTQKHQKNHRYSSNSETKLQKSMSCRSLRDLELEEVKGFLDLGFIFKKEHLNWRIMKVIPSLQRLGFHKNNETSTKQAKKDEEEDDTKQEEEEGGVTRPYLSEAWLIKRPISPLLNLKLPRELAAFDMKKHLRFWATTIALEIQQES